MTDPTDDDVRKRVRENAFAAAGTQRLLLKPILDPRDWEGGEVPDNSAINRIGRQCESAISAWVKTVEPKEPSPAQSAEERLDRVLKLFENPTPQLLEFIEKRLKLAPIKTIDTSATEEANAPEEER